MNKFHKVIIPTSIVLFGGILFTFSHDFYKVNGDTLKQTERIHAIEQIQSLSYLTDSQETSYTNSVSDAETKHQLTAIVQSAHNSNNKAKAFLEYDLKQEAERLAAEKAERERLAAEKAEQERLAAEKAEQERLAAEKAEQERLASEKAEVATAQTSTMEYTLSQFMSIGRLNWGGYQYTYYSQSVLPGLGLSIPGRHVNENGYVSDGDGYIVLANDAPIGTVFPTPFGAPGKVYDRGTSGNHLDVYIQ